MARLSKQMEELNLADSKGDYTTTWKIIHGLSGKDWNPKLKVKMRDGTPPKSDKDLLVEWQEYFSSLLNNDNGQTPSDLPQPAAQDLPNSWSPTYTWGDIGSYSPNEDQQGGRTWLCYYRKSSPGWRRSNGRCYPLILCWSVLKSDTTWPVDHQRHCPSTQNRWPELYDQL